MATKVKSHMVQGQMYTFLIWRLLVNGPAHFQQTWREGTPTGYYVLQNPEEKIKDIISIDFKLLNLHFYQNWPLIETQISSRGLSVSLICASF